AQRPVILPPLEAGSCRCSVKPASRCACRIMDREAQLSLKPRRPTTNLERAGQQERNRPRPAAIRQRPNTILMPPLG
ncbi:hypothetical protein GQ55_4G071800, partial [Panicum hallii var. hallii]